MNRREIIERFIPHSPLVGHLGMRLESIGSDEATLVLPFAPQLATQDDVIHGGAIASLIDTAGMAACWASDEEPESLNGSTVTLNVSYLTAARGQDLIAHATVTRRGRSMVFSEVKVTEATGRLVATGTVVQRLGSFVEMTQAEVEARALSRLAAQELSSLPRGIGDIHGAIAGRVFGALGASAAPVRLMHDAVSRGVYESVRGGLWLAVHAAGAAARSRVGETALSDTPRGAMAIAALNGLYGDRLEAEGSPLAITMQVRRVGARITPHLVVFLHGLGETEHAWGSPNYGDLLDDATPVFIRFNTGRHISENGATLATLLDDLVRDWPVEVERISIVGHSMGGLVARSACHRGGAWSAHVRHVISLGTPHMGAPLEQAVHAMSAALHLAPETRPFARFLRRRSAGIRDLRRGSLVDEDWRDQDADALRGKALTEVPLLDGATHSFVAATVTRSASHPIGRLIGDMLVLPPSASGRSRARQLLFDEGLTLGGTHHLALLNHPKVGEQLRAWLA